MATTLEKIQSLSDKNTQLIQELQQINNDLQSDIDNNTDSMRNIDLTVLKSRFSQSKIIRKKIEDNTATLHELIATYAISEGSLAAMLIALMKRCLFYSTDFPDTIVSGITYSFYFAFQNKGVSFSWNEAKSISLNISIYTNSQTRTLVYEQVLPLNLSAPENTPGEELLNMDYDAIKYFYAEITIPTLTVGEYSLVLNIKDPDITYNDIYSKSIIIT